MNPAHPDAPEGGPSFIDPVALTSDQFVTHDLPGIHGALKQHDHDFLVDEQPLYQPSGAGEHLYLLVEKEGLSTSEMVRIVAQHFGVREREIGFAGMKDKHAITRQVVSVHVPGKTDEDFPLLDHPRVRILWTDLHTNKLRVGHLRSNRFSIRLRDTDPTRVIAVKRTLDALAQRGVPNYYGEQRFGAHLNNHELGLLLIRGSYQTLLDRFLGHDGLEEAFDDAQMREAYHRADFDGALRHTHDGMRNERAALRALARGGDAEEAVFAVPQLQRRFWTSAFQSWLFNRSVADRLAQGTFGVALDGDVACRVSSGRPFRVDRALAEDPETDRRLASFEISVAGPMMGPEMLRAEHTTAQYERELLSRTGISMADLEAYHDEHDGLPGTRRPIRVPLTDPAVEGGVDEHGGYIRVAFELPPGSFATVVVREITKQHPCPEIAGARREAIAREESAHE